MKNNTMSKNNLLIIGSLAYDSIKTPFGEVDNALGGSATYFSLSSCQFSSTSIVGVVGEDFKAGDEKLFQDRNIDTTGIQHQVGKTFRWGGEYSFNLNDRTTLFTELNVLENFKPQLSAHHKESDYIFLGNIHPSLQKEVVAQITSAGRRTKFIGLDTMNYWIEKTPRELKEVLAMVDCFIINDSEARELSGEHNLMKAAKGIKGLMGNKGNKVLIIKRGEYGLLLFHQVAVFHLPGYPLEDVVDPTGAGDSFAGGFMGYLAKTGNLSLENIKRAAVYGSVMASFTCEKLATERLQNLTTADIEKRFADFKTLTHFEII